MAFDEWWHQQMPNLVSGEEADDRAIAEAAWAACARELFRDAVTVEVKAVGTGEDGVCRIIAYSTPLELAKGPSLVYKRAKLVLQPNAGNKPTTSA